METLLIKYGYFLLFLGVMVEGEAFLLGAAFLAHRGYFRLSLVTMIAIVANCTADQTYYVVARRRGRGWLETRFGQHARYQRVLSLMQRHADWLLLGSRFAFGFRIIIPAACGALGMPPLRFTLINIAAGIGWAVPAALLGYYFGAKAEQWLVGAKRYELWILAIFVLAGAVAVLVRHLRKTEWVEDLNLSDLHDAAPFLIGLMGLINLASAIWPSQPASVRVLESWLPLEVTQRSRPLMLFAGLALVQVTRNLAQRKELAWYVATTALAVSLLLHITRGLDLHHSLVAGLLLVYLLYFRRRFYARSDPASLRFALASVPVLCLAVFAYGYFGLSHMHDKFSWQPGANPVNEAFRSGILIREPNVNPQTTHAARFLGSLQIAGWLARLYVLLLVLRPVIQRNRLEAPQEQVDRIFKAHSQKSLSAFAIQSDKHHLLLANGQGLIAYATRGPIALACGDPLAPEAEFEASVREYLEFSRRNGWTPCVYEAGEDRLPVYQALGLRSLKIAEEALLDLGEFSLAGGKRANLRAMVNKVLKTGLIISRYDRKSYPDAAIDEQLESISQEWLAEKSLGEMGFTLGRFTLESLQGVWVFVAAVHRRLHAFCSWLPYRNGKAVVLDLMRKRREAVSGTMDLLLAHSLLQLKEAGIPEASLANAPLANVSELRGRLDKGVALLFENMNSFYGYKNLFQFKKKFAPRWEGRYLIYPSGADLPRVAWALASVHGSGGLLQLLLRR
jgi:phosphatidylglycerol lysyltransferase